ncbi:agmatinase [Microbaculum marinum]|uniref:Agmatinase n=1 Tax=Microbaculum marinum TaxID=1764581 RepID=A0AAW9RTB0_9HYPH
MTDHPTDLSAFSQPRYTEVPTFMRLPLATDWSAVDIGLIGVPYDGRVTNRPGARHGPRELRSQSSLTRAIHHVTKFNPFDAARIADLGDVRFERLFDGDGALDEIADFYARVRQAGIVPLSAGGDHTISLPILRGLVGEAGPVGLVHVDAHTDTWDTFQGSKYMHGTPFRRAVEEGLIDPRRTVQIGIRGPQNFPEGWDYSQASGMRVMFMEEVVERGIAATVAEARRVAGEGPTYLTFDIDSLDPAFAPGTGTPEIGGFTTREAQELLRGLAGLDLIGADLVEVSPPFDSAAITSTVGAGLMYEILCLLAGSLLRRRTG